MTRWRGQREGLPREGIESAEAMAGVSVAMAGVSVASVGPYGWGVG